MEQRKSLSAVLIETLWNVNCVLGIYLPQPAPVLIETLWNVNVLAKIADMIGTSINRNIVECKYVSKSPQSIGDRVLIETLWNVNLRTSQYPFLHRFVLIETLWNVNDTPNANSRNSLKRY